MEAILARIGSRAHGVVTRAQLLGAGVTHVAGSKRVDCRWPEFQVTVELDSYRFHNSRHSWEADRRREREAYARGDSFRRYTYGDVFEDATQMLRELGGLLAPARSA